MQIFLRFSLSPFLRFCLGNTMRQQIQDVLTRLEKHLEGKKFLVHDTFTLADICFAPRITMLDQLGASLNPACKNVRAWIERIKERESTQGLET